MAKTSYTSSIPESAIAAIALVVGMALGLMLPDTDFWLPGLQHRSIVTHGVILPAIAFGAARTYPKRWLRLLVVGLCIATIAHLSFDLFPRAWIGYAIIKVPFVSAGLGPAATFSVLWIAASMVTCSYLAVRLSHNSSDLTLAGAGLIVAFLVASQGETSFWLALLALVGAVALSLVLPAAPFGRQKPSSAKPL